MTGASLLLPLLGAAVHQVAGDWLHHHGRVVFTLCVFSVSHSAAQLGFPLVAIGLVDTGLLNLSHPVLLGHLLALLLLSLLLIGLGGASSVYRQRHAAVMLGALRESGVARILAAPLTIGNRYRTGDVVARLDADIARVQRFSLDAPGAVTGMVARLTGALTIIVWLDAIAGAVCAIAVGVAAIVPLARDYNRPGTRPARLDQLLRDQRAGLASWLFETLGNASLLYLLGAGQRRLAELRELHRTFGENLASAAWRRQAERTVPQLLTFAARLGALAYAGIAVLDGRMSPGELVALVLLTNLMLGPLLAWSGWRDARAQSAHCAQRIIELTDVDTGDDAAVSPPPVSAVFCETTPVHAHGLLPPTATGRPARLLVELAGLGFRYRPEHPWIIRNLTSEIPRGARIELRGPSGAGKSTLCHLLGGLLHPVEGTVRVASPSGVCVVPQVARLFDGTVAYNLRLASPSAADADLLQALHVAGLDTWVETQPDGLATALAEGGGNLSGGQRQRLALARALLVKPDLLVLDECLSEVDPATTAVIAARLDAALPDTARIVVAHTHADAFGPFAGSIELSR